ncbi:PP2C family serine/threonine-protein phosphatase [Mucilaginibacter sp. UR6-11]|uniref:PP2C family protein-serine/threonine phosphatase n=1 Tax=Mucilaginibacter sp. UR6-11 TaxID=1435644 RepID=UPI001E3F7DF2|nr:protein phosphatase 2C domain-containing protein [Mucilaginibacter sp. UR6-11]MCC8426872.1 protein phosphatase 2C domain-containing protein [Mucilaginibacter sp. UR6-11]
MADQFYGLTDTGKERTNNEDTFIAQVGAGNKFVIACVIDGVGGYSGGEVAAALAREAILRRLDKPTGEIIPIMIDCFNLANQKILDEKNQVKEHDSMACVATLALADIEHNQFYYAHVGDTRLYLLRDASLIKISHDQSFVGFLEESGRVTEGEAMAHPKRNEINKALGFEANLARDSDYIETGQSPFLPGDMLLLCSDGLTDMIDKAGITAIITTDKSLKDKCKDLINAANQRGGKDNITVVLVQNNKQTLKHDATMPMAGQKKNEQPNIASSPAKPKPQIIPETQTAPLPSKNNFLLSTILSFLVLLFLGTTIWQYVQNKHTTTVVATVTPDIVRPLSAGEIKLQTAINSLKGNVLLLSDSVFTSPIHISRAIQIKKDTLFIKTRGKIELLSDTGYTGAAFNIDQQCKLVLLDSLNIKNFKTAIVTYNNALLLKNVRFDNCAISVQHLFAFADNKYINGGIQSFKADTLPVTHK